ncbi:helix-turn-helix domain-containing protein [Novosphingobium sp. AAP83]|uniref:helix-turn-helix domain-containing protein n=1 Tax=Novosphingobium sp. AAP83 TaxID=1523425 RepID=UPI0006B889DF|nr:helix-turn-helix domain-containing protein [Novosphingobium sp. AAP83]
MFKVLSTRTFPPAERLDYWNDLISAAVQGMTFDSNTNQFDAKIVVWELGDLKLVKSNSPPATFRRKARDGNGPIHQSLVAHLLTRGRALFEQRGRQIELYEGDMVVCAAEEFYCFASDQAHEVMVVELDRAALVAHLPQIDEHLARPISGKLVGTRLVQRYMSSLWQEAGAEMPPAHAQMHATILTHMIAACLEGSSEITQSHGNRLLAQAEILIAERIGDCDLDPSWIAAEMGVPLRTLQATASSVGETLGGMIMRRRLHTSAQRLLAEPHKKITAIAMECGFADSAHFTRRFQKMFGSTPSRYRSLN